MSQTSSDVRVETATGAFNAYLSTPNDPNGVVVVVLQEIFGVNDNIRQIVDDLGARGYAAIAPDLYWRQQPDVRLDPFSEEGRVQAMALMKGLNRDQAVQDGVAALAVARERMPELRRSAALGYCFGGGVAYLMAVRNEVDAGISYYGTGLQAMLDEAAGLQGRLLIQIAGDDHLCPPDAQKAIGDAVAAVGDRAAIIVHPGVSHAFARQGGASFNVAALERADSATEELLASLVDAG